MAGLVLILLFVAVVNGIAYHDASIVPLVLILLALLPIAAKES